MTNRCPFCTNYAYAVSVGDAYQMDCRYCDIQVEITKRAYTARCPDPVGVLEFIREKMKTSTRPRVDLADMKRLRQPPAPSQEEEMTKKTTNKTPAESDVFTTAAKAIGTTLGKIAVKTGIAKTTATVAKVSKKAVANKKTAAPKAAPGVKKKAAPRKSAPLAKSNAPARKRKLAK